MGYLSLDEPGLEVTFDGDARSQVAWIVDRAAPGAGTGVAHDAAATRTVDHDDELERVADIPLVTFTRGEADR
jgi:hypothetical protein